MAEKEAPKKEAPVDAEEKHGKAAKGGGLLSKTPVLLGGVMIIEAVVLFAGMKFLGAGAAPTSAATLELSAEGEGGEAAAGTEKGKTAFLIVVEFKAPNKRDGRTFLYDVKIAAEVKADHTEKVKETLKDREALIMDRVRTIIAQSDPEKLGGGSEPGLETLQRQVKHQLDEIVGEGMIEQIVIPRCIPIRVDF